MATIVLSVVGGIFGGPIGAALGGLAGNAIDRDVLFSPKGREGPRLKDLSVQTSSYGSPIQRVFGTMRVAGSVIWSTDLVETRSKSSAGKGQPSVTSYSYSVSFAVLLSARPIAGIGRIWADGNLLRGAAGDFKTQTGFRYYAGTEDQAPDPLIASAEGLAMTPAMRGCAYAVFENLQLADYGNRLPSLTFEVIAENGTVTTGSIAGEIGGGLVDGSAATAPLVGFAAYGGVREVLDLLASAANGWFAAQPDTIRFETDRSVARTISDSGFAVAGKQGSVATRTIAPIDTIARSLTVAHYDPARDYQTGVQRALRPGPGNRATKIDLPAATDATTAKAIAETSLADAETAREQRTVTLSWGDMDISPGDVVAMAAEPGAWRVESWALEHMVLTLDLTRLAVASAAVDVASSGRLLANPDMAAGMTLLEAFEIPPLDDAALAAPRLSIAANGSQPGWRRAALMLSTDNGARFTALGSTAVPATLGTLVAPFGPTSAALVDRINSIDIALARSDLTLTNADDAGLDSGANLALIGDELIQYGTATPMGGTRWRLSTLWRGRRGTEWAIGTQSAGDRFVLLDADAMVSTNLPLAMLGGQALVLASGLGDTDPARAEVAVSGASLLPPSPIHLLATRDESGNLNLAWVRRSRQGRRWIDGVDVPLVEESERYRVAVTPSGGASEEFECATATLSISAAGAPIGSSIAVRQVGSAGESRAVSTILTI